MPLNQLSKSIVRDLCVFVAQRELDRCKALESILNERAEALREPSEMIACQPWRCTTYEKRLANRVIRDNTRRWYVPTALTMGDALTHHFAHKGLFATGCDHLNVRASANLKECDTLDIVWEH